MDPKIKKRITMFYIFGTINALLGLYVLIEGPSFVPADSMRSLLIMFGLFAALNFYFPYAIKKKLAADAAARAAQGAAVQQQNPGQTAG